MSIKSQPTPLFDTLDHLSPDFPSYYSISQEMPSQEIVSDYQKAYSFLYSYRGSAETFKSYRREIERLLQWSWFLEKKTLKQLRRNDFETFIEFCQSPPKEWIGIKQVPRFLNKNGVRTPHPEWRPFIASISKKAHRENQKPTPHMYTLSQNALQAIFAILSSFYHYLEQEEYVTINPISQIRQKSKFLRKKQFKRQTRRLSELQWRYVIKTAEQMAEENPLLHERTLFIMNALFGMYLRISELAAQERWIPQMGHFYKDMDNNWWFKTVGKGNKERDVSVSNAMLAALKRYRISMGLTPLPSPGETTPLLRRFSQKGIITGTRHIRKIVQDCFDRTITRLQTDGFQEDADTLAAVTVHWLRHTGISEDVKTRPREHVRDDAGHSSSAITDLYIDIESQARHDSAKKKPIKFENDKSQPS